MRLMWCVVVLVPLLVGSAQAVSQTLEEVERQVEAAERKQREQAAAARREAEARAAREAAARREREQSAAAAAAAQARMGTLIVRADRDCVLTVNGEDRGRLQAEQTQQIKVAPGQSLIECVGEKGSRAEATERIPAGEQVVVRLTVPPPGRFEQRGDGIFDAEQGVIWAASDNGSDIDWNGARSYCSAKGGGWSLPTVSQLQSLYDEAGTHARGWTWQGTTYQIKFATPLIRWTSCCFWSSETSGSAEAFYVDLGNGSRDAYSVSYGTDGRALCVRRP